MIVIKIFFILIDCDVMCCYKGILNNYFVFLVNNIVNEWEVSSEIMI